MHDLDGNGQWDENEVRILFRKELEKAYDPNNPEDDMKEREEEMERGLREVRDEVGVDSQQNVTKFHILEKPLKFFFLVVTAKEHFPINMISVFSPTFYVATYP